MIDVQKCEDGNEVKSQQKSSFNTYENKGVRLNLTKRDNCDNHRTIKRNEVSKDHSR